MEIAHDVAGDVGLLDPVKAHGNGFSLENLNHQVDEIFIKVDQLEQKLNVVEQFYLNANKKQQPTPKCSSALKDKEKHISGFKRRQDAARCEVDAAKRMQELMRQFGTLLRQITQHKSAAPFMQPVDVVGLKLDDYHKVIVKPMDFSTIKNKMEAKDGTGYKHVREICADVRLIFKNAMKYNDERDAVHEMARTLLGKFEEKWHQLSPKVDEEEKRRKEEEARFDMQLAHAKMARELSVELDEVDMHLDELRDNLLRNCRKTSTEEKRKLGTALSQLSPEDLNKALLIVAANNPNFQLTSEEVDLDMDVQSESTLWKLKSFVKDARQACKNTASAGGNDTANHQQNVNNKRKKEICVALGKTSRRTPKSSLVNSRRVI